MKNPDNLFGGKREKKHKTHNHGKLTNYTKVLRQEPLILCKFTVQCPLLVLALSPKP